MKTISSLLPYFNKYYRYLVASIFANILLSVFTVFSIPLIIPFFQILFDRTPKTFTPPDSKWNIPAQLEYFFSEMILNLERQTALFYVCLFIVVIFLLKNLFRYLSYYFLTPAKNGIIGDIRNKLMHHYLHLPLHFFTGSHRGDLLSRMSSDALEVEVSIINVMEALFKAPLIIAGSLLFMVYISLKLTLFVLLLLVVTVFVIGGISKTLKKQSRRAQELMGNLLNITEETLSGIRIIKGFGGEQIFYGKFSGANDQYQQTMTRLMRRRDLSSPLSEFLGICVVTVLLFYGSTLVFRGQLMPETFFAFIFAFYQVIEPSKSFSTAYYNMQKGAAALDRIQQVLSISNPILTSSGSEQIDSFRESLVIDNLSFQFDPTGDWILKNIQFEIKKGKHIALVGASGAGKTTLVNLLPRFYEPTEGKIWIDGKDYTQFSLISLRNLFGIVTQEPTLFHDTVRNNITLGMPAEKEQVVQACKIANAHEFIMNLKDGYETVIGDRGEKLSGGQKQRLTIARAILKNPAILILDEATSALDATSEKLVKDALDKAMKERTVITIAHKYASIARADLILVLKDGEIIQRGTHKELSEQGGSYYNQFLLQQFIDN